MFEQAHGFPVAGGIETRIASSQRQSFLDQKSFVNMENRAGFLAPCRVPSSGSDLKY